MSLLIKGMEMPKVSGRMEAVITILKDGTAQIAISPADDQIGYWKEYPLVPVPPHGRLGDLDKIGLTNFEIILCQNGNPFKNALEMLLEKIENAPTLIEAEEGE